MVSKFLNNEIVRVRRRPWFESVFRVRISEP